MPATKVITAVAMVILTNVVMPLGANQDLFATVPDPWRTVITSMLTFTAAYLVKERNLTADQLHGKG